jgi:spore maturation protein CgeB
MRFLITTTYYPAFLSWLYRDPDLARASYVAQLAACNQAQFGVADFYSTNLRRLGHEAWDVHANNGYLQMAWAREHGLRVRNWWPWPFVTQRRFLPCEAPWFARVLRAQVEHYRPQVIVNLSPVVIGVDLIGDFRAQGCFTIVQHAASRLPAGLDWSVYGLGLSSFPPTVSWFRSQGIPAQLFRLGFEASIAQQVRDESQDMDVSFVGSLHPIHRARIDWLEEVCSRVKVDVWTPDAKVIGDGSPCRSRLRGRVWGREMYRTLARSRITLNHHGSIEPYANNMRLYEATGTGTLLITDWKENLAEMFAPGKEVVAYHTTAECVDLIRYYLQHDQPRQEIAAAGQQRTLASHSYRERMAQLVQIVAEHRTG